MIFIKLIMRSINTILSLMRINYPPPPSPCFSINWLHHLLNCTPFPPIGTYIWMNTSNIFYMTTQYDTMLYQLTIFLVKVCSTSSLSTYSKCWDLRMPLSYLRVPKHTISLGNTTCTPYRATIMSTAITHISES